ncbi:AsmA family protein [Pannonibacter phragmitetus]|uniref:AsmA family protein n=1 Tax=Pannonibacter phragmitetus TaxID=121719 RepID=UPI003D2F365B
MSFRNTAFTLDGISGSGEGSLVFGAVPKLTASLVLESLPLDPYLGTGPAQAPANAKPAGGAAAPSGGAKAAKGWSNAPVDFGGLAAFDADLTLTAKSINWDRFKLGNSALKVVIADGVLNADLQQVSLYGGEGKGTLTVEGGNRQPQIRSAFTLSKVGARDLLRDATGISWLDGSGFFSYDINTRGSSEAELIGNLGGEAKVEVLNGAILGVNLPDMVRNVASRTLLGWQQSSEARTDFTTLTASFQISNGVAVNQDLALAGPLIQMTGSGTTDMPGRMLDWRVEPQIVPSLQGIAPTPRAKGNPRRWLRSACRSLSGAPGTGRRSTRIFRAFWRTRRQLMNSCSRWAANWCSFSRSSRMRRWELLPMTSSARPLAARCRSMCRRFWMARSVTRAC